MTREIAEYVGDDGLEISIVRDESTGKLSIPFFDNLGLLPYQYEQLKLNKQIVEKH